MKMIKKNYVYVISFFVLIIIIVSFSMKPTENQPIIFQTDDNVQKPTITYIYVDIKGAVVLPGVYKVESSSRLFQVIELAGGLIEDADDNAVNLSTILSDQDVIYIPTIEEGYPSAVDNTDNDIGGVININVATIKQLQELSGIGPSTAQSIIDYRDEHGPFTTIEEIMNVSGIGESTFEEIKDAITT